MGIGDLSESSGRSEDFISRSAGKSKCFRIGPKKYRIIKRAFRWMLRRRNISLLRKTVIDHWYDLPVVPDTILLCGLGRHINGSLRYLLNVLNKDSRFEGYRIFVRTTAEQTDDAVNDVIRAEGWTRTETVPDKYDMRMETCQYLLTESWFPYQYTKRPDQILINIWHGTPLKHLGCMISGDKCHVNAQIQKNFLSADYLLYPNDFTRDVMWQSYQITHLLTAKSLMMGYPRTAGILKVTEDEQQELRRKLAPSGGRIFAYMPTFREYMDDGEFIDRIRPVLEYLDDHLEDGDLLLVNLHHYHHRNNYLDVDSFRHIRKFPDGIDTYKVLSVTDVLISDYSSIFFDFLITGRPVILYVEDLEEYLAHQGLNMDIKKLPLSLAFSKEDLLEKLYSANTPASAGDGSDDISGLYKYDEADVPEKLCGLFCGDETGLRLSGIPEAAVPTVLLYSDGFISDPETGLIRDLAVSHRPACPGDPAAPDTDRHDPDGYEVYVGCDEEITEAHKDKAYPWLHDVNVIASLSRQPLSSVGAPVKDLYLSGKISSGRAMALLSHEYALSYTRWYGNARLDMIFVMDSCDPETIIGMALSPVKHKLLLVSEEAVRQLKCNRFLRDAVRYSSEYYDLILTYGKENSSYVRSLLPLFRKGKLLTADCAEELDEIIRYILNR